MKTGTARVFAVVASALRTSSTVKRSLQTLSIAVSVGMLAALPAFVPASTQIQVKLTASGPWLNELNAWRANAGLSSLSENVTWSDGDYKHALYMVKNDEVAHQEVPGHSYYTPEGDAAARASNIYVSSSTATTDVQAIDWWMQAPFHAIGMMDPRLGQTAFGSYRESKTGWDMGAAVDVQRGNPFSGGQYPVFFPGNGTSEPMTTYGGGEFPDPLQACPGYSVPTGLPVFIQVGGNVATTAGSIHSFVGNGVPLEHCVIDSQNPAVGSGLAYRGGVIVIPRQPLVSGVRYVVSLTVNGTPYSWSFTVGTLTPFVTNSCTKATAVATPAAPTIVGTQVTITAGSTGCPNPTYEFFLQYPDGTWVMKQPFGPSNIWNWNTSGYPAGTYTIHAWANQSGTYTYTWQAIGEASYTLTAQPPCATASLSASTPSGQVGTIANMTAGSTGCSNPQYEFWLKYPDGTWMSKQPFGGSNLWSWNTTGYPSGAYTIHVWANQGGSDMSTWQALGEVFYAVTVPCTGVFMSLTTSAPAGSAVALTAAATGCPSPQYEYWAQFPSGAWSMQRAFSSDPNWSWSTTGLAPGTYTVHAWANQQGDQTASLEAFGSTTVTLTGCTSAGLSPANPSQAAGSTVAFSATSSGCPNAQYEYWVQFPSGTWSMQRGFSSDPTWSWSTTGLAPGTYTVHVWANQQGAFTGLLETAGSSTVTLTACTSATLAPTNPSAPAGTTVNFTASSAGCLNPSYEFWVQYLDGSWHLLQPFGANTFAWNTSGLRPGTYAVHVWANNRGDDMSTWEANGSDTVTLTGCTSAAVSPPSGSASVGTKVTFTATSSGCPTPIYAFWLQYPDGTWHLTQTFSPGLTTWQWDTTGFAKGSYTLHVWANNQGSDYTTWEQNASATLALT